MKLQKLYNIIVNDTVYYLSTNLALAFAELEKIKKTEPKAYIMTTYA